MYGVYVLCMSGVVVVYGVYRLCVYVLCVVVCVVVECMMVCDIHE